MQRILWMLALGLAVGALAAAPLPAQTRVRVAFGVAVPPPFASGVWVVRRPYCYRPRAVLVPYRYRYDRPFGVRRGWVSRRSWYRYRHDWDDRDDGGDGDRR